MMIKYESPDSQASLALLHFFSIHSLIFLGALGLTLIVWHRCRKIWNPYQYRKSSNPPDTLQ